MPKKSGQANFAETPATRGYRMPAEWEPHAATWIAWPHHRADWPGKFEPIRWVFAEIIRNLAKYERVEILVNDEAAERKARQTLARANADSGDIRFHRWPTDRIWLRDSGPIFLQKISEKTRSSSAASSLLATTWKFNAWAKYPNYSEDAKVGARVARKAGCEAMQPMWADSKGARRVVLEGGSIDTNGDGILLTTEECLLSEVQQRNPGMTKADYERVFAEYLGMEQVIWLGNGIAGDDTHGHVDDISRFVARDTVLTAVERDVADVNHAPLAENLRRLKAARTADGRKLQVVELPMPKPVVFEGRRLPASYANFYIANGVVLAPVFNDANDRTALNILAELFPSREIVPIYSGDFIWGFGAMHCMTQQQPAQE